MNKYQVLTDIIVIYTLLKQPSWSNILAYYLIATLFIALGWWASKNQK